VRAGPALNPLKGSSARLPHEPEGMHAVDHPNLFIFNPLNKRWLVKTSYPRGKIYAYVLCQEQWQKSSLTLGHPVRKGH
jgi:hypothetical protein